MFFSAISDCIQLEHIQATPVPILLFWELEIRQRQRWILQGGRVLTLTCLEYSPHSSIVLICKKMIWKHPTPALPSRLLQIVHFHSISCFYLAFLLSFTFELCLTFLLLPIAYLLSLSFY